MTNINFAPKDFQRILSIHKIAEKYNQKEVFYKAALKHFAIFTGKHLCWSIFLIKFIITKLQHRYFPVNIARFLRASIL